MEWVKQIILQDVIEKPISGEWGNEVINDGDENLVKVIRTTNFTNVGVVDFNDVVIRNIDKTKVEKKRLSFGDIIIEKSGGTDKNPVGRVVFCDDRIKDDVYLCNNFTTIFRVKESFVKSKYLFYYLFYNYHRGGMSKYYNKTTGIQNLKIDSLIRTLKIPVLPILIQQKIVQVLDDAQSLIDKRKEQIKLLDKLTESIFYEMFGDPVKNEKGWGVFEIGDCFDVKTGKTPSRKKIKYWRNPTVNWVKTAEIINGIIYSTEEKISREAVNDLKLPVFKKGTILIAMYGQGATRGRVSKINIETTTNQACAGLINIKKNRINEEYVFRILLLSYENLRMLGRGGNQPNLNLDIIKKFKIPIPPLPLQNEFASKVEAIEKQKQLLQDSLKLMEDNYNNLMQRAFKGELFS